VKRKLKVPVGLKRAQKELEQATRERQTAARVESAEDLAFHLNEQGPRINTVANCPDCGAHLDITIHHISHTISVFSTRPKAEPKCTPSQLT